MALYTLYPNDTAGSLNESTTKEQVADAMVNLFPEDSTLQRRLPRRSLTQPLAEFPVDTMTNVNRAATAFTSPGTNWSTSAVGTLARPEGNLSLLNPTPQYPGKLKSVSEIQQLAFEASHTEQQVAMYGIPNRFVYEGLKTARTCVQNREMALWWSPGTVVAGTDLNALGTGAEQIARQSQGLMYWILFSGLERQAANLLTPGANGTAAATHTDGAGNTFGTGGSSNAILCKSAMTWAYNANGQLFDEAMFKDQMMLKWWTLTNQYATGKMCFASPRIKSLLSRVANNITGPVNQRNIDANSKAVIDSVDFYTTDYGTMAVEMNRHLALGQTFTVGVTTGGSQTISSDECLVMFDPQGFQIGTLAPLSFVKLAKLGATDRAFYESDEGLCCLNPQYGTAIVNAIP